METESGDSRGGWTQKLRALLAAVERVEQGIVTLLLTIIILLATYQIGLRWFTSGGLPWIDPLLRYSVLWGGLLGAVLATARSEHISLDVVSYLIPDAMKPWLKLFTLCFSAVVSGFLFQAALLFLKSEMEFGGNSLFGFPYWVWYLVFPLSFGLITIHFAMSALLTVMDGPSVEKNLSDQSL